MAKRKTSRRSVAPATLKKQKYTFVSFDAPAVVSIADVKTKGAAIRTMGRLENAVGNSPGIKELKVQKGKTKRIVNTYYVKNGKVTSR